jgi:hypothetical protein
MQWTLLYVLVNTKYSIPKKMKKKISFLQHWKVENICTKYIFEMEPRFERLPAHA